MIAFLTFFVKFLSFARRSDRHFDVDNVSLRNPKTTLSFSTFLVAVSKKKRKQDGEDEEVFGCL